MAMPRQIKVEFNEVFPHGLFAVSSVEPTRDFEKGSRENPVQALDRDSGLPLWQVDMMDADPEARKAERQFTLKIAAKVQPVLPQAPIPGMPFVPVELDGLTASAYLDRKGDKGEFSRVAWSFRASGLKPGKAPAAPAKNAA